MSDNSRQPVPPVSSGELTATTADATLGTARTRPATGTVSGAQSVGVSPSSTSARQGGEASVALTPSHPLAQPASEREDRISPQRLRVTCPCHFLHPKSAPGTCSAKRSS